jgi:hypothetical protein
VVGGWWLGVVRAWAFLGVFVHWGGVVENGFFVRTKPISAFESVDLQNSEPNLAAARCGIGWG